jgi:hypothetical protein
MVCSRTRESSGVARAAVVIRGHPEAADVDSRELVPCCCLSIVSDHHAGGVAFISGTPGILRRLITRAT